MSLAAKELVGWARSNPREAWIAGIEVPCLEMEMILSRPLVGADAVKGLYRLEAALSEAKARIERKISEMEEDEASKTAGQVERAAMMGAAALAILGAVL